MRFFCGLAIAALLGTGVPQAKGQAAPPSAAEKKGATRLFLPAAPKAMLPEVFAG